MSSTQSILDSRSGISKLDKLNMLSSIENLGNQIKHAWIETRSLYFQNSKNISNILVAGMGGSALGADVIRNLFKQELSIPLNIVNDYTLPHYVNESTMLILSSYSGNTEEIMACAKQAREKNAQIAVICAGGELAQFAKKYSYPLYQINPIYNPSNQPRMAIGYSVFGTIGLLERAEVINLSDDQVDLVIKIVEKQIKDCTVENQQSENPAKALAFTIIDRRPIIVASEFLEGSAHVATNQLNENSKIFADYKVIPEIDHHLLEGLSYPRSNSTNHVFIFIQSQLLRLENIVRVNLTQKIVEDNQIDTVAIPLRSSSKIEQVFEMITLFSFASFYLAMLEGIDPSPIPYVESFKKDLKAKINQMNPLP